MASKIRGSKLVLLTTALGILLYAAYWIVDNQPLEENEYRLRAQTFTNAKDLGNLDKLSESWVRDHPKSAFAHLARGDVLRMRGDMNGAAGAYGNALELDQGNFQLWAYHGIVMLELGVFPKSKDSCARSLALNPNHAEAWYCIALAQAELSAPQESLHALSRVEALNPPLANAARGVIREHTCRRHPELAAPLC